MTRRSAARPLNDASGSTLPDRHNLGYGDHRGGHCGQAADRPTFPECRADNMTKRISFSIGSLALCLFLGGCDARSPAATAHAQEQSMSSELSDFAKRYGEAWSSQKASSVASFFAENGSLKINDNPPSVGRAAITDAAQSFMTAFPDLHVTALRRMATA
jgi:SnoaL-like polyketide cyclase